MKTTAKIKASVAIHTITSFLLGVAMAFTLALFYLAPFLMTSAEVKAFWQEVLK